ncbi:hypothetical protein N7536_002894 [Penicillium majusculum]|nr:hypothetical protein N7536_002894 [Penicillium majusculum]
MAQATTDKDRAASSAGSWLVESRKSNCNPPSGYITLNVVKLLPDKGTEIAAANNKSLMPLHSASLSGHLEVVKLLLKNGAAPKKANEGEAI